MNYCNFSITKYLLLYINKQIYIIYLDTIVDLNSFLSIKSIDITKELIIFL